MKQVDHIGIAVRDLSQSIPLFEKLLNQPCYKQERVESQQVTTAFFAAGQTKIELLEGAGDGDPISRFIQSRGEGIHHIAFEVADIDSEIQRLKAAGFAFIAEKPTPGADNKMICFLHPRSTAGVLIELCMEVKATP